MLSDRQEEEELEGYIGEGTYEQGADTKKLRTQMFSVGTNNH